ncbi:sensor histidine kinase [Aquimarina sp. 2201CG5-10]|uniref:sensor histidine kinase n=1 Tax=Aquimarina callyspongiae TaxID=3098150 RepID=UPI002AB5A423|nr:histidine kinase [Aquimarina sp. 2201CG5-10]MDY8135994.1 histidine kinase [Aquimarina sp. 2201CG5-10]
MKESKNIYQKFLKIEPLCHIFIWSIVLFYPYIKYAGREGGYMMSFTHELNSLFFKMTISYFLYLWYFPRKSRLKYIPLVIITFLINTTIYGWFDGFFHEDINHLWMHFMANLLTYISFGIVFFTVFSLKKLYKKQIEIDSLIKEKQQAELKALKAQVNPHFLFNTLNTIYANALRKDDKTPDLILKLSDSFRYLLHEGQNESVTIKQEIQHVQDYINLQQERLSNKIEVDFSSKIDNKEQRIAPLLLIGFVENAFKYTSVLKGKNHQITINIKLDNNQLIFQCKNPFDKNEAHELDYNWKKSGVGIKSTQNRLQLLYPEKHQLKIIREGGKFIVTLKIQI